MTTLVHDLKDPRRATIVRHARQHFVTHGFTATRMEPVARESGVSTATLYGFFESKNTLFEAVINDATDEIAEKLETLPTGNGSAQNKLDTLLSFYADFLNNDEVRAVFRLILSERHRFEEVSTRFFSRGRTHFGNTLIELLQKLSKSGELKGADPTLGASQLMGMIENSVFFNPLIDGDDKAPATTPDQLATEAVKTYLARFGA
jgi:AcrR family transcriptional regulator